MQAEKRVMNRRGVEMSQSYFEMMQHVYDETKKEREDIITRAKGMAATEA
jgi:hypothetical protein